MAVPFSDEGCRPILRLETENIPVLLSSFAFQGKGHRKVGGWCSTVLFFPANTGLAGGGAAACMCHLSELLISR